MSAALRAKVLLVHSVSKYYVVMVTKLGCLHHHILLTSENASASTVGQSREKFSANIFGESTTNSKKQRLVVSVSGVFQLQHYSIINSLLVIHVVPY